MFTGIVRELGRVSSLEQAEGGATLVIEAPATAAKGPLLGDSVALNGCCLTVTALAGSRLTFTAVLETLQRTSLGSLAEGSHVNVEPALRVGDALGGHIVQGHVDGLGEVLGLEQEGEGRRLTIGADADVLRYCVFKGSIAVDGVSLTVARVKPDAVEIALIPHTLAVTTLGDLRVGDRVNLEVDVIAKHVERLVSPYRGSASS